MSRQNRLRKLEGNFALGCGPGTDYPSIHIFQCILERTDAITKEVRKTNTFFLVYPTVNLIRRVFDEKLARLLPNSHVLLPRVQGTLISTYSEFISHF